MQEEQQDTQWGSLSNTMGQGDQTLRQSKEACHTLLCLAWAYIEMTSLEDRRNLRTYVRALNISEGHGWRRCQLGNNNLKGAQVIVDGGDSRRNNFRDAVAQ